MIESQDVLRRALNLTLAIYRLTRLLPREEPMGWQMRKLANEIIGDLALANFKVVQKRINLILLFFEAAKIQEWVKPLNWETLKKEYECLSREVVFFDPKEERERKNEEEKNSGEMSHNIKEERRERKKKKEAEIIESRWREILKEFESKKQMKISEIIPLFKKRISERTLRNDLNILVDRGFIKKKGFKRSTTYFLV